MANARNKPHALNPSRVALSAASAAGFVWMTAAMGPILKAEESLLVEPEPTPVDPAAAPVTATTAVSEVAPATAPKIIILEVHRTVAAPVAAAPRVGGGSAAPQAAAPPAAAPPPQTNASG